MTRMPPGRTVAAGGSVPLARRGFLRALCGAGLGATALGTALTACSDQGLAPVPRPRLVADRSRAEPVVRFANWVNYIDTVPGNPPRYPTLEEFSRQTAIAVDYSEPITGNEQFLAQLGIPLAMGWAARYDIVVLTDWVLSQLIQLGWAQPLSPAAMPNASRLLPQFRSWPVPDVRRYSLPWQCGFTGIAYNLKRTHRPVTSMTDLLTSPDLHGKVALSTDMRDVVSLVMLDMGVNPSAFTERDFGAAVATIGRAARAGQIGMVSNYWGAAMTKGAIAAAVGWPGDVLLLRETDKDIYFTWPKAGGLLWSDNMVIPVYARHTENAERLMNFYYQPAIAAQLSAYERYMCPVVGAEAAMRKINPALVGERFVFPTSEILRNGHFFKILTPEQNARYIASYQRVVGL
jgi:spermidine/putrescine transport system substrate-binding protein